MTAPTAPSPRTLASLGRRRPDDRPPTATIVSIAATYDPTVDTDQTLHQTRDQLVAAVRQSAWYQQRARQHDDNLTHLVGDLADLNGDDLSHSWGPLVSALCVLADTDVADGVSS